MNTIRCKGRPNNRFSKLITIAKNEGRKNEGREGEREGRKEGRKEKLKKERVGYSIR